MAAPLLILMGLAREPLIAAGEPDASDPRIQALRVEYAAKRDALLRQQADELGRIAANGLSQAQQMQAKAKLSGNVTAQAAANAAVRIYTDAGETLKKTATLQFATNIRPDLEAMVDTSRKAQQACVERTAAAMRALDAEYTPQLGKLGAPPAGTLQSPEPTLPGKLTGGAHPGAAAHEPEATNAPPGDPVVIRTSRDAAQWEPVLRGEIHVTTLEIITIPVNGINAPRNLDTVGDLSGERYSMRLTPYRELALTDPPPAFRVMSLPPLSPVEVVSWPTLANGWTLELRIRPTRKGLRQGFVLEAEPTVALPARPVTGAPKPSSPSMAPYHPAGTATHTTSAPPATVATTVPAGIPPKVVLVPASGPNGVRTGIQVRKGTHIQASIVNNWSCGQGGEYVDADGYPNNDRFFRYYINPQMSPRITLAANYGALIARILPEGAFHALGKQTAFTADKTGELTLDINEDPASRRDNKGTLEVRLIISP